MPFVHPRETHSSRILSEPYFRISNLTACGGVMSPKWSNCRDNSSICFRNTKLKHMKRVSKLLFEWTSCGASQGVFQRWMMFVLKMNVISRLQNRFTFLFHRSHATWLLLSPRRGMDHRWKSTKWKILAETSQANYVWISTGIRNDSLLSFPQQFAPQTLLAQLLINGRRLQIRRYTC